MVEVRLKTKALNLDIEKLRKRYKNSTVTSLQGAGGLIRTIARRSIRRRITPSKPGNPPHTTMGLLRDSIAFKVNKITEEVVVGPRRTLIDDIGTLHEFGGKREGGDFPKRPYMGPALRKAIPKLGKFWADSLR